MMRRSSDNLLDRLGDEEALAIALRSQKRYYESKKEDK